MSNKVAVVTDSTASFPQDCLKQYNISVTPLSVIWGDHVYLDGVDILPHQFYQRLRESRVMPTTSQVTPAAMQSRRFGLFCRQHGRGWRLDPVEMFSCPLSPVIGTHVDPGTLALNYMSDIS